MDRSLMRSTLLQRSCSNTIVSGAASKADLLYLARVGFSPHWPGPELFRGRPLQF